MATVDNLVNAQVIAALLNVTVKTVYRWAAEDFVPHYKVSPEAIRFSVADVLAWLATRKVNGRATRLNSVY